MAWVDAVTVEKKCYVIVLTIVNFSVSELNQQNSGKASILCEATRFLKDVFGQIEVLRKENTSLLSESSYVSHLLREALDVVDGWCFNSL